MQCCRSRFWKVASRRSHAAWLRVFPSVEDRFSLSSAQITKLEGEMATATQHFDAVVIGAGFSGLHMLKSLRDKLGLKVRVYETGGTVGGTCTGTATPARVAILTPTFIASPGTSNSCKSGNGPNAIPSSPKSSITWNTLPNATT